MDLEAKNWLALIFFLLVISLVGLGSQVYLSSSVNKNIFIDNKETHAFLRDKKISIKKVVIGDLLVIENMSHKKALLIIDFVKTHNELAIDDLLLIKGIGKKTLVKLKKYFY